MNKLIVIGHLGRDPEMRYLPSGGGVTNFSVASSRRYTTSAGEQREETEWFNCSAFGRLAETCNQYLTKGKQVYVEGRLSSRTYQTQGRCTQSALSLALSGMGSDTAFRFNLAIEEYRAVPLAEAFLDGLSVESLRIAGEPSFS